MTNLADVCCAVTFTNSVWTGRRMSEEAARQVAEANGIDQKVGRYWKDLIKCDEFNKVKAIGQATRMFVYESTLPWRDGSRIIPASRLLRTDPRDPPSFPELYNRYKIEWDIAVESFLHVYDSEVAESRRRLGPLFDERDYPSKDELRTKFHMNITYDPRPTANDFRIKLTEEHMARLKADLEQPHVQMRRGAPLVICGSGFIHKSRSCVTRSAIPINAFGIACSITPKSFAA